MTTGPLPDLLESEARTRHYVDGTLVTARRGINWPAGTVVTDDDVNERVDLSGLGANSDRVSAFVTQSAASEDVNDADWTTPTIEDQVGTSVDFEGTSFNTSDPTIQILTAGVYTINAIVRFDPSGAGTYRVAQLLEFGSELGAIGLTQNLPPVTGDSTTVLLSVSYYFPANDSITITFGHDAGAPLDVGIWAIIQRHT